MSELRTYGNSPFRVAVVHGGPGAPGEMAPVARELAKTRGVLEPLQTGLTVDEEVEELRQSLEQNAEYPAMLIGYSWGAWLGFMLTARYPTLVARLILVGSPPFAQEYAFETDRTRFGRLNSVECDEIQMLKAELDNPDYFGNKNILMATAGKLFSHADSFNPLPHNSETECRWNVFSAVWPQAVALRRSGALLKVAKDIKCPVVAIHGDYDPHPADGVRIPLSKSVKDFRFILLQKCGHMPWFERQARDSFYEVMRKEIE